MKRCLILQGGGLRGAFVAGACFALADLRISQFDLALAVSASVPTLAYFLAGQCREGREVWENYLCDKKFIRYSNVLWMLGDDYRYYPLIDLHYLIYQVFRDRFPLKVDRLLSSRTEAYFVATDSETSRSHYFRPDKDNIYQVMRACMALPGAVPEKTLINGHFYVDGGIADPVPITKALELGADRLLVILTAPPGIQYRKPGFIERTAARRYFRDNPAVSDICCSRNDPLAACLAQLQKLQTEAPDTVLVVRPQKTTPARRITRNRRKIVRTLNMGYDEIIRNQREIRAFLK